MTQICKLHRSSSTIIQLCLTHALCLLSYFANKDSRLPARAAAMICRHSGSYLHFWLCADCKVWAHQEIKLFQNVLQVEWSAGTVGETKQEKWTRQCQRASIFPVSHHTSRERWRTEGCQTGKRWHFRWRMAAFRVKPPLDDVGKLLTATGTPVRSRHRYCSKAGRRK